MLLLLCCWPSGACGLLLGLLLLVVLLVEYEAVRHSSWFLVDPRLSWVSPILLEIRIERWGSRPLYLSRKLSGKIAVPDKKDHFQ